MEREKKHGNQFPGFKAEVGKRIRELEKRFTNRAEAAAVAGVAKSTLQNWGDGQSDPSFEGLARLAAHTKTSLDWIATGAEADNTNRQLKEDQEDLSLTHVSIDCSLLQDVVEILEERLQKERRYLTPAKKARLISEVYALVAEREGENRPHSATDRLVVGMLNVVE